MFDNQKLSTKIIGTLAVVICGMLIISVISYKGVIKINSSVEEIAEYEAPLLAIVTDLEKNILKEVSTLDSYIESGGYQVLNRLKSAGTQQHNAALDEIELAALKGLGGAGFPPKVLPRCRLQMFGERQRSCPHRA